MKRAIFLATVAFLVMMMMAPVAIAQVEASEPTIEGTGTDSDLPSSGGPAILLPAAALLLGSGILTFAVLRRR